MIWPDDYDASACDCGADIDHCEIPQCRQCGEVLFLNEGCEWPNQPLFCWSCANAIMEKTLNSISGREFLTEQRQKAFQMQGRYDGAMSERCKQMFADDFRMLDKLVTELTT